MKTTRTRTEVLAKLAEVCPDDLEAVFGAMGSGRFSCSEVFAAVLVVCENREQFVDMFFAEDEGRDDDEGSIVDELWDWLEEQSLSDDEYTSGEFFEHVLTEEVPKPDPEEDPFAFDRDKYHDCDDGFDNEPSDGLLDEPCVPDHRVRVPEK